MARQNSRTGGFDPPIRRAVIEIDDRVRIHEIEARDGSVEMNGFPGVVLGGERMVCPCSRGESSQKNESICEIAPHRFYLAPSLRLQRIRAPA